MLYPKTNKSFIFSTVLLCTLAVSTPCQADDFDDFLNDESTEIFLRDNAPTPTDLCDPKLVASNLVQVGVIPILEQNLYLHTNELTNRSLLDYPIFLPRRWRGYTATFGFDFFWNKTNRMYFTQNSSAISSYLNIGESALLDAVTNTLEQADRFGFVPAGFAQPARFVPLFRNFTVEQRRLGLMFHAEKRFQKIFLYCFVPLYYIERNMFASEIEQEAITAVFGRLDQESQDKFGKDHVVSDKFGLGDTRLSIDFQIKDSPMWGYNLGFFATFPTAFAIAKNINGSSFDKVTCPPKVDILETWCNGTSPELEQRDAAAKSVETVLFGALDNFAANVLDTPLGNGGHVGLGFATQLDSHLHTIIARPWANALDFSSRISLEYLIPSTKSRMFLLSDRSAGFQALGLDESTSLVVSKAEASDAYSKAILDFCDQQITEILFPTVLNARVHPGFIFRYTGKTYHDSDRWYFALGNDFWLQSKEKLTNLDIPQGCFVATGCKDIFNVSAAQKPVAYQGKTWGTVAYKVLRHDIDWILSLNMDTTWLNSGIGADYTISVGFETHF
jgi:hypothetical protein